MQQFVNRPQQGKFDDALAEYLYNQTLDGYCEETGNASDFGEWVALVDLSDNPIQVTDFSQVGQIHAYSPVYRFALVSENSQGFVSYNVNYNEKPLRDIFDAIDQDYGEWSDYDCEE